MLSNEQKVLLKQAIVDGAFSVPQYQPIQVVPILVQTQGKVAAMADADVIKVLTAYTAKKKTDLQNQIKAAEVAKVQAQAKLTALGN